ncbi:hypothetical protein [Salisediminibacterium selenitireducens]|nr:hypothetical protein [Salisediminibacterium selenitireducens]
MPVLQPSFLGKKVFMDQNSGRQYMIKYERFVPPRKIHALLFDQDVPVIFAILDKEGRFLDSFFLSNKTTADSAEAMEAYKVIADRKAQHKMTQDDLQDALKPESEAKMKNKHIRKHLKDEHLEDIKHQWPSRLISLQNAYGRSDDSLIIDTLRDALAEANGQRAFDFITTHRIDRLVPLLAPHASQSPELIRLVPDVYLSSEHPEVVYDFLLQTAETIDLGSHKSVEELLNQGKRVDLVHHDSLMKRLLTLLMRRVKDETDEKPTAWLSKCVHDRELRATIMDMLKKPKAKG